jgi:hypothetical protein
MKTNKNSKKNIEKELITSIDTVFSKHEDPIAKKLEKDIHSFSKKLAKKFLKISKKHAGDEKKKVAAKKSSVKTSVKKRGRGRPKKGS